MYQNRPISSYTRPKKKTLKIVIFSILLILLSVGIIFGAMIFRTLDKITGLSVSGESILSLLNSNNKALKGQDDGRTNILLLGGGGKNHPGGGLTDSIMVISINWKSNKMAVISVPRDLWVNVPGYGYSKINKTYSYGEQDSKASGGGGKVASDLVGNILGIPIHYFISMDFAGFEKIINTVGGVDIDVPKAINDPLYPAADMVHYDPFSISAGPHHMDGALALKYARSRETTSDFDRSKRQQLVLAATKKKVLTLNVLTNPAKVTGLLNAIGDHLRTNLSVAEIKAMWDNIKNIDMDNIVNQVFDTSANSPLISSTSKGGAYIIIPKKGIGNYNDLQTIAQNIFSNSSETVTTAKVEILNGSGTIGRATSAADIIKNAGYKVASVGNASVVSTSIVYNCGGTETSAVAQKIAVLLSVQVKSKISCENYDIQVVIGKENSLAK